MSIRIERHHTEVACCSECHSNDMINIDIYFKKMNRLKSLTFIIILIHSKFEYGVVPGIKAQLFDRKQIRRINIAKSCWASQRTNTLPIPEPWQPIAFYRPVEALSNVEFETSRCWKVQKDRCGAHHSMPHLLKSICPIRRIGLFEYKRK